MIHQPNILAILQSKRFSLALVLFCLLVGAELHLCQLSEPNATPNWKLVWREEFDGDSINETKWSYQVTCQPQNKELQCYTKREANAYIDNGKLKIHAKPESYSGKKYTSARLYSQCDPGGSFLHGKFEMRAKLPKGKHLWPAFWMIPADNTYGTWSRSGEIDIFEYRGQKTGQISSALHYGNPHKSVGTGPRDFAGVDFSKDFHNFTLIWTSTSMTFYMDGTSYWNVNTQKHWGAPYTKNVQPWDQRFHIIINLAVGGSFFNGYGELTDADVRAWTNPIFEIDYIRVYQDSNENNIPPKTGLPSACKKSQSLSSTDEEKEAKETKETKQSSTLGLGIGIPIACVAVGVIAAYFIIRNRRYRKQEIPLTTQEESFSESPPSRT